uniref:HDC13455 n=1 Tax=Drosophila melanogaster TaxID=7227 RepID=Q6IK39_DROME|nr:TPA_inf: HDC13455 [Drosophila melanogaster]
MVFKCLNFRAVLRLLKAPNDDDDENNNFLSLLANTSANPRDFVQHLHKKAYT